MSKIIASIVIGLLAGGAASAQEPPAERPLNVLWIIGEDLGPELGCFGTPEARTPHLDGLAAEGVRFTRAFTASPVCSPSRSGFMTGMYATTIGAHNHRSHRDDGFALPEGVRVITDWLRPAGYFTANVRNLTGKKKEPFFKGTGKTDWNFHYEGKPFDGSRWDELRDHEPFYAQVNFSETHRGGAWNSAHENIEQPADPAKVVFPPYYPDHPLVREDWAQYLNAVMALDRKVGFVLRKLEEDGLADRTVVFFFGDHGRAMVRGKQWPYDSGLHVPLLVRWPKGVEPPAGLEPGTVHGGLVSILDVTATTLAICGVDKPERMQGRVLFGPNADPARRYVFGGRDRGDETVFRIRTARDERFRYLRNFMPERPFLQLNRYKEWSYPVLGLMRRLHAAGELDPVQDRLFAPHRPAEELYDLEADPWETVNLAESEAHADVLERMRGELDRWIVESDDQGRVPEPPEVVAVWERKMKKNYAERLRQRAKREARGPNVVLVMTDDQGYGDLGFHGNPVIRTPNLDAMAGRSARMETFYVSPVCAPTRAALMTGRYSQRTRAIDTYIGRAMMEPEEVTVAEALRDAGWATGIFGKWHLGDCYPMRAMDQGFEEVLVHRGGGIGQPSDPEGGESKYTDAVLFHNGARMETKGYCTDVYFDAALDWMRAQHASGHPFFAYIPTNAPHGPFHDVPPELLAEYEAMDLSPERFPREEGYPLPEKHDAKRLAQIFAMITNVDENVGRLFAGLEDMGALEDTLVIYLVDNGPNSRRYVAGMRGNKSSVHDGGVRSPFFAHWPGHLTANTVSDRIAAHVDVLPTILDACDVDPPAGVKLDGRSILPLLEGREVDWPDRTLFVQAHRGNEAVRYHHFLARGQRWKLLNASGFGKELKSVEPAFELYDMEADPGELVDLAAKRPDVVASLRAKYDAWFDDVSNTRSDNYAPPRIVLGAPEAPEVHLTRQDWRRSSGDGGWNRRSIGHWLVDVKAEGPYRVRVRFLEGLAIHRVVLRLGDVEVTAEVAEGRTEHTFEAVPLPVGPGRLETVLEDAEGFSGAYQLIVTRN